MAPGVAPSHYEVMGLTLQSFSEDDLKKQYRALCLKYHPDRNRGNEATAEAQFKVMQEAYTVLADSRTRFFYDRELHNRRGGAAATAASPAKPPEPASAPPRQQPRKPPQPPPQPQPPPPPRPKPAQSRRSAPVSDSPPRRRRVEVPPLRTLPRAKVVVLGSAGTGKSSLVRRYCEGVFDEAYEATVGADLKVRPVDINGETIRANIVDMGGAPGFREVRNELYKDATGIVLVFDITDRDSFDALSSWLLEAMDPSFGVNDPAMVLCGNKSDEGARAVSELEARTWADTHDMTYFEASAKSGGEGVRKAFDSLISIAWARSR